MVTHNASFMLEREREEEFASWLRSEFPQLSEGVIGGLAGLSMSAMREAGGVDYREAEAQTVAFQARFNSIEEARQWSRTRLAGVAARFEEKFGPQAMVYTSIFEDI